MTAKIKKKEKRLTVIKALFDGKKKRKVWQYQNAENAIGHQHTMKNRVKGFAAYRLRKKIEWHQLKEKTPSV